MKAAFYIGDCAGRGMGVFSHRRFRSGDYILQFKGELVPYQAISDFTHYLQFDADRFLGPSGEADDYVNHSCEPNSAVYLESGQLILRALSDIGKDDEIVFDYGTVLFREPTVFQCDCGSSRCRGLIGSFQTLPAELQAEYRLRNMVPASLLAEEENTPIIMAATAA